MIKAQGCTVALKFGFGKMYKYNAHILCFKEIRMQGLQVIGLRGNHRKVTSNFDLGLALFDFFGYVIVSIFLH